MHPMEFSPFAGSHRPQNRMIGYRLALAKSGVAFGNYAFHTADIFKDFRSQLRNRSAARKHGHGRLAARRKKSQPKDSTALPALAASVPACSRFSGRQTALAVFDG